jgi:FKBP-type peptidyl-prolyl cis-trans isomerase
MISAAGRSLSLVQGDKSVIAGLQDAILGMRAGGKRRVLVPPQQGYTPGMDLQPTPPTYAAQRQILNHAKEPLMFELQLVKIRNKGR